MERIALFSSKNIQNRIDAVEHGEQTSRTAWGAVELNKLFGIQLFKATNIFQTTFALFKCKQKIVYIDDFEPWLYLPFIIFKRLKNIKFVVLMHAHPYGKGRHVEKVGWLKRSIINLYTKGITKALFFSPLSLNEAISNSNLTREQCFVIHWGEDKDYIESHIITEEVGHCWISTGKERRDVLCLTELEQICSNFIYIRGGLTLKQCQQKIAKAQGVVVIPSAAGLTYCTGWTTIVEALAFGKPIICVDNPYYPFNIEKEGCGIYVTNNPNDIRDTILKLQNNPHILMNMKKNALRMSLQYNMAVFREELKEIIEK